MSPLCRGRMVFMWWHSIPCFCQPAGISPIGYGLTIHLQSHSSNVLAAVRAIFLVPHRRDDNHIAHSRRNYSNSKPWTLPFCWRPNLDPSEPLGVKTLAGTFRASHTRFRLKAHWGFALRPSSTRRRSLMDDRLHPGESAVLSESPRRSPQINEGLTSPARSVHPELYMNSMRNLMELGVKTADFFDDTSEDDADELAKSTGSAPDVDLLESRAYAPTKSPISPAETFVSRCGSKIGETLPRAAANGYQALSAAEMPEEQVRFADTPSSSFNGSVDELLPSQRHSSPPNLPRQAYFPRRTPRSSAALESSDVLPVLRRASKADQRLGAHAIAHEITLNALMRDEDALDHGLRSFSPMHPGERASILPTALRAHDPRSPRVASFHSKKSTPKRVHLAPPPIDTSASRQSIPADFVRTPYPYEHVYRKDLDTNIGRSRPPQTPQPANSESLLTVSIRRINSHSRPRITTLTIPATNDFSVVRSSHDEKERHLRALDFDDEVLFRRLRHAYASICGPWRYVSARALKRIVISGPASQAADAGYGWLVQPRSPRALAHRGLSDTFDEDKILQNYRQPRLGRSRYAFVQWAHRLAAAPMLSRPPEGGHDGDMVRRMEQPEGLEFVVVWSASRVLAILSLVIVLSVAASLLWIFLGQGTTQAYISQGGFMGAGDRVAAGVLMGICTLMFGLCGMAGWLGLSWLIM